MVHEQSTVELAPYGFTNPACNSVFLEMANIVHLTLLAMDTLLVISRLK